MTGQWNESACVWPAFNDSECSSWTSTAANDSALYDDLLAMNASAVNAFSPGPLFQTVIYSMYSVIFALALVGNLIVCAVVFTSIRKWTVTNFFIVNMAASDILMAFFCIPFTFVPTFVLLYWPFGAAMCRIVSFSQAVSVFVSAYTMVAISSDRYLAIVYPLRPRMTRKQAKWIIVAVWLAGVFTALPILVLSELVQPPKNEWYRKDSRYICTEVWSERDQQSQYTTVLLLLQYCFPLAVLVFTYGRIVVEIWGKKTPGEAHQHRDLRLARSKRKMIKMMIIVVFFFAFCWLPFNVLQIIADRLPDVWTYAGINYVAFACHWLAMSHSAYNPIIYCCFNSKFRQGFNGLALKCGCRCVVSKDSSPHCSCDCGAHNVSATQQHSANGDTHSHHNSKSGALQRANTLTTYTSANSSATAGHHRSMVINRLAKHQCSGRHNGHQSDRVRNGRGSPGSSDQCCQCSVLSPSQRMGGAGRRPQKFVFRANFTKPSTSKLLQHQHVQQHQLLLANSKPPTQRPELAPLVRNTSAVVSMNAMASAGSSSTAESNM